MILDSRNIGYEVVDITEPGKESDKDFMQNNSKSMGATVSDLSPRHPLPPQIFNDEEYCGVSHLKRKYYNSTGLEISYNLACQKYHVTHSTFSNTHKDIIFPQ